MMMNGLHNLQDKIDYIFENNDSLYSLVESKCPFFMYCSIIIPLALTF